LIKENH